MTDLYGGEPSSPRTVSRELRRAAGAIATYWSGGAGPSHSAIDGVLAGYARDVDTLVGNKQDKVQNALLDLAEAPEAFWQLAQELIDLLDEDGFLATSDSTDEHYARLTRRLRERLAEAGRGLGEDARITSGTGAIAPSTVETVPACREQIERLRRATAADDGAQVLGVAKELVESTIHVVLRERGREVDSDWELPRRAKEAELSLLLHQSQHDRGDKGGGHHVGQILRSLHNVADNIVQLRNALGTGHGNDQPSVQLPDRLTKLVAGSAIVYCEMLLDTLQDPHAPWRRHPDL